MTERERQVGPNLYIIISANLYNTVVIVYAKSSEGAFRVAEAEHPGVVWVDIAQWY